MNYQIEDNPFAFCRHYAGCRIHLGISGSIACYKTAELLRPLLKIGLLASATLTTGAKHFVTPLLFRALGADPVYGEMFEDEQDVFDHLEPGKKSSLMAVVPASANFLARLATGEACDMLSAQALAFEGPLLVAPAMNPKMWNNSATRENIAKLLARGVGVIPPEEGETACGDNGAGRLASLPIIFLDLLRAMSPQDMLGMKVLVTIGPTREYWDDVRFWSNSSSGKMGGSLATAAWLRGAEVTAICGPCENLYLPEGIKRIDVISGQEMYEAANALWPSFDLGIFCAAVCDFYPVNSQKSPGKIHRDEKEKNFSIQFGTNRDILAELGANKNAKQKTLGFAAEIAKDMEALAPAAQKKLHVKQADLLAANRINPEGGAFGTNMNSVLILDKFGRMEIRENESKADIAWNLLTWLLNL